MLRQTEIIFQNTSKKLLKNLNLHNVDEAFEEEMQRVRSKIKDKKYEETKFLHSILSRGVQICENQCDMVGRGVISSDIIKEQEENEFIGELEEQDHQNIKIYERMLYYVKSIIQRYRFEENDEIRKNGIQYGYAQYNKVCFISLKY